MGSTDISRAQGRHNWGQHKSDTMLHLQNSHNVVDYNSAQIYREFGVIKVLANTKAACIKSDLCEFCQIKKINYQNLFGEKVSLIRNRPRTQVRLLHIGIPSVLQLQLERP